MARRGIPEINAGSMADIAFLLLIFFLVTTTMDKDQAYVRRIPKKIETDQVQIPPPIEERNICAIKANALNQLMFREEIMTNPDEISDRLIEFYTTNEKKNDPANNFPMYSHITKSEIDAGLRAAEKDAEDTENTPGAMPEIIDYKWNIVGEWETKKQAIELYGKNSLPEIHGQAHVRIEIQKATEYKLFAKIQSEIEEAIFELRDGAAMDVFGESYGTITRRYGMDKSVEDKEKLALLKILYPDRFIEVAPKK